MQKTAFSVLAFALMSTTALAQENGGVAAQATPPLTPAAPAAVEMPKRYTVTVGVDFPTSYMFRGIHQESTGFIAQPPVDLGVVLSDVVTLNVGQWHSLHSGPTGNFYESDYYGSLTFTAGKLKPGVLFTSYTSPNDRFATVQEIAAFVSVDDSASKFPLSPKATVAFELDGQADGGARQGTYFELGIRPAVKVIDAKTPLTIAMPVRLGVSLKDYYEGINGSDTFGFFSSGLIASVPITVGKLTWDVHGGVEVSWLGQNLKFLNANDAVKPVGVFGLTLTY
jgi:hypothetical protein